MPDPANHQRQYQRCSRLVELLVYTLRIPECHHSTASWVRALLQQVFNGKELVYTLPETGVLRLTLFLLVDLWLTDSTYYGDAWTAWHRGNHLVEGERVYTYLVLKFALLIAKVLYNHQVSSPWLQSLQ